jgi:hypothetical protein
VRSASRQVPRENHKNAIRAATRFETGKASQMPAGLGTERRGTHSGRTPWEATTATGSRMTASMVIEMAAAVSVLPTPRKPPL